MEDKNGITEQIESDNLQYLFALLTTASHITSHAEMSGSSIAACAKLHAQRLRAYSASGYVNVSHVHFIAYNKFTVVSV